MKLLWIRCKQLAAALFLGLPVTVWLLARDRNTVYFIPHAGLGDYCIALGYLDAYKKRNQIKHITVIAPKGRIEVSKFYPYWNTLLVLPQAFYMAIVYFGSIPGGRSIHRRTKRIVSVSYMMHLNKKMLYNNPAAHADGLARLILKLPDDIKRQWPCVPTIDISDITARYGLKKGRTVLLNPYTGGWAVKELDRTFYEQLADKLIRSGYCVATILGSVQQSPIAGTCGIVTTLAQTWHLARWCGWVVGTRSGFFDFIQFSGCSMIAIYEKSYKLKELFALLPCQGTFITEYIYNGSGEQADEIVLAVRKNTFAQ